MDIPGPQPHQAIKAINGHDIRPAHRRGQRLKILVVAVAEIDRAPNIPVPGFLSKKQILKTRIPGLGRRPGEIPEPEFFRVIAGKTPGGLVNVLGIREIAQVPALQDPVQKNAMLDLP
jgi:hypothetical protein